MADNAEAETPESVKFEQKIDLIRLNEFRLENRCCDVRFEINGKIFPCHRIVMILSSPYFDAMFNGNFKESDSDIISLKDIETETFEEILNAIYTGSIRLLPSNACTFLKASHLLLLDSVQNACVSYIRSNINRVHYLVEIYLFSDEVPQFEKMRIEIEKTIAKDLICYGQTDSFTRMPVNAFKKVLSIWHPLSQDEEFTFQLISKWARENNACYEDIQKLLLASGLKFLRFLNPMLMARCIAPSDDAYCAQMRNQICDKMDLDVHFDLNVYLNAVDVKTGEKGWCVLKITDTFNTYVVSSFHPTISSYRSVCHVGSVTYCFEYFNDGQERNSFSCYDGNNVKIPLRRPEQLLKVYQMASRENSIYLMAVVENRFIVWCYDCDLKIWEKLLYGNDTGKYDTVSAYTYFNGFFYVILGGGGNETLYSIDINLSNVKKTFISWNTSYERYMLCGFDNKLVLCNVLYDSFSYIELIDLTSERWLDGFNNNMKFPREKFCITYHSGFIYAVESNRTIVNEKFNLETRTWDELPALPKQVTFESKNGVMKLAIGSVFSIDS